MFTGLVQETARVLSLSRRHDASATGDDARLVILSLLPEAASVALGASVALNGACLTVVDRKVLAHGTELSFEVSPETLARTNLGALKPGAELHVELALCLGQPLGGHLLSGHVDGLGLVVERNKVGDFLSLRFELQNEAYLLVGPYLVEKGSIAIDGVSLTVNKVYDLDTGSGTKSTQFEIMLIPHTLEKTFLGRLKVGDRVNLEADLMAKYVNRYQSFGKTLQA